MNLRTCQPANQSTSHDARPPQVAYPSKQVTVFTASVFPDVARLWHTTVRRVFPAAEADVEIFADCDSPFEADQFPGATILPRTPTRRDHHEAYNEALKRVQTPYLAIIDSDVFWLSPALWPRVKGQLSDPKVASVGCIAREGCKSHGTFSVVLKVGIYRELLQTLPSGFNKAVSDATLPPSHWTWDDTGDRIAAEAVRAGYEVKLQRLDQKGDLVKLDTITVFRLASRLADLWTLERGTTGTFFWRGCLGNLVLKSLHDRLFPDGPAYDFDVDSDRLARALESRGSRQAARVRLLWKTLRRKRTRIEAFLGLGRGNRLHGLFRASHPFSGPSVARRREPPAERGSTHASLPPNRHPGRLTLHAGEFYRGVTFGPDTVNQGAVLMSCEWNGGLFLAGSMMGGIFHDGEFRGGVFWGGIFLGGTWRSGTWWHGFDARGRFRHYGEVPGG